MVNAERWTDGNAVLLGDACHALHPGQSQGMNVAIRSVASLAERLVDSWADGVPPHSDAVATLLAAFEAEHRPPIADRLEANHQRGLQMDNMDAAGVERTRAALSAVAADPEKLRAYCMNAAGY